ncbi:MAG: hypothetical protein K0B02_01950 [DPANN group archaeon]|nr:hypothetical protein [DPANN group archaeon]
MYNYISYIVPMLLCSAFIIVTLGHKYKKLNFNVTIIALLSSLIFTLLSLPKLLNEGIIIYQLSGWQAPFGITVAVDGIGFLILSLIFLIGLIVAFISKHEIKKRRYQFYTLFMFYNVGLVGMTITGDIFNFFVFLEISSMSAYILSSFNRDKPAFESSIKYIIIGSFASSIFLIGIAMLYGMYGTLNMADLMMKIVPGFGNNIPLALILTGLFMKGAIVPFHAWKPDVVKSNPASFGLAISATSTAVSLYAIFRFVYTVFGAFYFSKMLIYIALLTMFVGAVMALQQKDLKKMIAYSAISQSGYILFGFGLGMMENIGFVSAIYHLINTVIIDAVLFISAYIISQHFKTSDMSKMGYISRQNKLFTVTFGVALLSLTGIPFLNGFASKWMLYIVSLSLYPFAAFVSFIVSVITLAYSFKAFHLIFLNDKRDYEKTPLFIPLSHKVMLAVLLVIMLVLGFFPDLGLQLSQNIIDLSLSRDLYLMGVLS